MLNPKLITRREYNEFLKSHVTNVFTTHEISRIRSSVVFLTILNNKTDIELNNGKYGIYYQDKSYISVEIEKYQDEWYLVRLGHWNDSQFLICDQFDELIHLITHLTDYSNDYL